MAKKRRLIELLLEKYPDHTKKELYASVMCGEFSADGHTVRDPLQSVPADSSIARHQVRYVSRGGKKLDWALSVWNVNVHGGVFLDAGCSTGGFTHCLLSRGASCVHAVDVGYNQIDWKLRNDPRVIVHERTNVMDLVSLDPVPDAAVADLSFRSLRRAAVHIIGLTNLKWAIALIKPQFEYSGGDDSFDGVIRDRETVASVVRDLLTDLEEEGVYTERLVRSPIRGGKGNTEFLALFRDHETAESRGLGEELESILLED